MHVQYGAAAERTILCVAHLSAIGEDVNCRAVVVKSPLASAIARGEDARHVAGLSEELLIDLKQVRCHCQRGSDLEEINSLPCCAPPQATINVWHLLAKPPNSHRYRTTCREDINTDGTREREEGREGVR